MIRLPAGNGFLDPLLRICLLHVILFLKSAQAEELPARFGLDDVFLYLLEFGLALVAYRRVDGTAAGKRHVLELLADLSEEDLGLREADALDVLVAVIPLYRKLPVARKENTLVSVARLGHELQDACILVISPIRIAAHHALRGIVPFVQVLERHPGTDEVGLAAHAEHRGTDALPERGVRREEQIAVSVQHVVLLERNLLYRRYLKLGQIDADARLVIPEVDYAVFFRMVFVFGIELDRIAYYDVQVLLQKLYRLQSSAEVEDYPVLQLFERSHARVQPRGVWVEIRQLVFRPFNRVLHCVSLLSLLLFTLAGKFRPK